VVGGFKTKHSGYDALTAFVPIEMLRQLVGADNKDYVNEIAIRLKSRSPQAVVESRKRIERALLADERFQVPPPYVLAAGQQESGFLSAVDHQRGLMKLVLFVIIVVAGFLVYATLSMMVTEKTHDIGVLSALGATRGGVLQVFITCGLAITLAGTVAGIVSGCVTSVYLDPFNTWLKQFGIDLFPTDIYNLPHVPYELDPWWISIVGGVSLAVGALAAAIPALRAMSRDPLACLRNG
jgi:lipoprotein-releasing system permease protein